MTAEIINLNKVRKAKARAEKEQRAEENRVRHGRTKAERDAEETRQSIENAHLDGMRRELPRDDCVRRRDTEEDLDPGSVS